MGQCDKAVVSLMRRAFRITPPIGSSRCKCHSANRRHNRYRPPHLSWQWFRLGVLRGRQAGICESCDDSAAWRERRGSNEQTTWFDSFCLNASAGQSRFADGRDVANYDLTSTSGANRTSQWLADSRQARSSARSCSSSSISAMDRYSDRDFPGSSFRRRDART